jgi:nicotinamidase-related amidase
MACADSLSFGEHYAILNIDWMSVLIHAVEETPEGKALVSSLTRWNIAIHRKTNRPLTIFTTLAFSRGQPEVEINKPFSRLIASFGSFEDGSPNTNIDPRFVVDNNDILLRKTRWSVTTGSNLEQILKAQGIDTVIIVGDKLMRIVDQAN